jgi:hypothetical protein
VSDFLPSYIGPEDHIDSRLRERVHKVCATLGRAWRDDVVSWSQFIVETWSTNEDGVPIDRLSVVFNLSMPWPDVYHFESEDGRALLAIEASGELKVFVGHLDHELQRMRGYYLQRTPRRSQAEGGYPSREQLRDFVDKGKTTEEIAEATGKSPRYITTLRRRYSLRKKDLPRLRPMR